MDSSTPYDESRKRKRIIGYSGSETAQRQQQRGLDRSSSLFFSDDDDDDNRSRANSQERSDRRSNAALSKTTNGRSARHPQAPKLSGNNGTKSSMCAPANAPLSPKTVIPIKQEYAEEHGCTERKLSPNHVTIYVSKHNAQLSGKREDLVKSSVLSSWITDDSTQGAYIMRPQLLRLDLNDFDAVLQYIHSGEYAPMLMENPDNPGGPKLLDGLKNDESYTRELVRSGRIYVIAQEFQVEGMSDQIFRKITEIDTTKFSNHSLVELAGVIFKNDRVLTPSPATTADGQGTSSFREGRLEKWIVCQLAKNFREIMRTAQALFWRVERETSRKCLFAQVLEEVAKQYREIGGLPVADCIQLE